MAPERRHAVLKTPFFGARSHFGRLQLREPPQIEGCRDQRVAYRKSLLATNTITDGTSLNGIDDHPCGGFGANLRANHQVVVMWILPIASVIGSDIAGAFVVC